MARELRVKLTRQFVILFILLYFFGGALAMIMFAWHLDDALDDELRGLTEEILPSIEYHGEHQGDLPTLASWAGQVEKQRLVLPGTIQLFDQKIRLLETYGPKGGTSLLNGTCRLPNSECVRSLFVSVNHDGKPVGYLQIQVSTKHRDQAIYGIVTVMVMLTPILALAVAVCGSWFAGKAVQPVERTVALLRQFVADAGHEINTPITVIEASSQTLVEMFHEHELPTEVLDIISRANMRMKDLGDSLILLSRMETPQLVSPKLPVSIADVVNPVIEECNQIARSKNINLTCSAIPGAEIVGHTEALQRMLQNLLANALRYTEAGGKVSLTVRQEKDDFLLEVEDTGIGIPAESLPHLFERFYRVDKSRSRAAGGSGLGLSIVNAIVESHGGSISVTSELGKGSKFTVRLPVHGGTTAAATG